MADLEILKGKLEPEAERGINQPNISVDFTMKLSIAISLKRIADVLDGRPDRAGIVDILFDIIRR